MSDATEAALIDAICDDPLDETRQLVYADWLTDRGYPHGERLHVQRQIARDPGIGEGFLHLRTVALSRLPRTKNAVFLLDRGLPGLQIGVRRRAAIEALRPRHLQLVAERDTRDDIVRDVEALGDSDAMTDVAFLDLAFFDVPAWSHLMQSRARPRMLALPYTAVRRRSVVAEGPLFERVRAFEMKGWDLEPWTFEPLVTAPWMRDVTHLSLQGLSDECAGLLACAELPRLRSLDLRNGKVAGEGLRMLSSSSLPLEELKLSIDQLRAEDLVALERSKLADIARLDIEDPHDLEPETYAALVRSRAWSGALYVAQADADATLAAIVHASDARPLRDLFTYPCAPTVLQALLDAPCARSLRHLSLAAPTREMLDVLARSSLRLESLQLRDAVDVPLALFAAPCFAELRMVGASDSAFAALAACKLELEQVHLESVGRAALAPVIASDALRAARFVTIIAGEPTPEVASALVDARLPASLWIAQLEGAEPEVEAALRAAYGDRLQPGVRVELPGES